jgi:hypothetical protein
MFTYIVPWIISTDSVSCQTTDDIFSVKDGKEGSGREITISWTNKKDEEIIIEKGGKEIKVRTG